MVKYSLRTSGATSDTSLVSNAPYLSAGKFNSLRYWYIRRGILHLLICTVRSLPLLDPLRRYSAVQSNCTFLVHFAPLAYFNLVPATQSAITSRAHATVLTCTTAVPRPCFYGTPFGSKLITSVIRSNFNN